ncbi:MAG TPA: hypothetical protein DDZ89_06530 [Clostridiales bacterium]|nr:hypothetical protein [Clostridiales bacterium]
MKKKRKKKSKLIFLFLFIVYIVFFLRWVYDRGVPTDIIKYGNIDYTVRAQGVLLRDELFYALDLNGKFIPSLSEGSKVSKDAEIAVAMKEEVLSLFDQRQEKAKELYKVRSQAVVAKEELNMLTVDISVDMRRQLRDLTNLSTKNFTLGTTTIAENLQDMITGEYLSSSVPLLVSPQEKVLQDQINVLDSAIGNNKKSIYAGESGIVSYKIDQTEQFLNFGDYSSVSLKQIDALRKQYNQAVNQVPYQVVKNQPFVKVITDFRYRILSEADQETIDRLKSAGTIQIKMLNKGMIANATLDYTGKDPDGRGFVVLVMDEKPERLSDERFLDIEIVCDAHKGYKVPLTSLFDINDNTAKIIVLENSFASFKEVEIAGKNSEYAIIQSNEIDLYDIFVLDPRNIKEGQVLN